MKHRRFLALLLTLCMALSLLSPALAAEDTAPEDILLTAADEETAESAPEWEYLGQYSFIMKYLLEEHPEIREDFDADAFFAEEYSWWEKDAYMKYMGYDEDEFENLMWEQWAENLYEYYWESDPLAREIDAAYGAYLLETYEARHPGELDGLTTEILLTQRGYHRTLTPVEQYMENRGLSSEEAARDTLLQEYVSDRLKVEKDHAGFLDYQARYPDKWVEFDADAYFEEDSYYSRYYSAKEEYMNHYTLLTEEEFAEAMFIEYVNDNLWLWAYESANQGNRPGVSQPSLVINGERYNGKDFVLEDGASYLDGVTLNELLGTDYAEGPVAIRTAAQAAGWDVVWNEWNSQVILLDREKLTHGVIVPGYGEYVEYDFSAMSVFLNGILAAENVEVGETLQTTQTGKISLTLMDSLDGDKTYDFGVTLGQLSGNGLYNCDLTLDLADLTELLGENILDQMMSGLTKPNRQTLVGNLGALRGRLIWNQEEETIYVNLPVLALLDESLDPETWYSWEIPVESGDTEELEALLETDWNPGELIYQNLLDSCATSRWFDGEDRYLEFVESMGIANVLFGTHAFTQEGDTLTWSITDEMLDGIGSVLAGSYDEDFSLRSFFREFACTLTLEGDGSLSFRAVIRPDMKAIAEYEASEWDSAVETAMTAWQLGQADFRYEIEATLKNGNGTFHADLHWKNQVKLTVDTETKTQETDTLPLSAPPQDSTVEPISI